MFRRLSNSWQLVKASMAVLRADKELIIFPIVSAVGTIIVTATFFFPMLLAGFFDEIAEFQVFGYLIGFAFYIVQYFVIFFANTALVGAAMIRLRGGDPTVGDGFRIAFKHIGSILGYALMSATVGMILRAISERAGLIGRIVVGLIGFAWSVATYLVVPVLVIEEVGPIDAVKRSATLLKKTWGEQIVGNFSISAIFGLLTFLVILVSIPLIFVAIASGSTALIITVALVAVITVIALALINSALSGIYAAAVYQYAADGKMGEYFDADLIQGAFRRK